MVGACFCALCIRVWTVWISKVILTSPYGRWVGPIGVTEELLVAGKRILIIEDDEQTRFFLVESFEEAG